MKNNNLKITSRIASFRHAFNGIKILFREEANIKIHLIVGICTISMSWYLNISALEWISIIISIATVIITEGINTAIENICDVICAKKNNSIKKIKDISAGAVLLSSIMAICIGLIIFLPKLLLLFNH